MNNLIKQLISEVSRLSNLEGDLVHKRDLLKLAALVGELAGSRGVEVASGTGYTPRIAGSSVMELKKSI